MRFITAFTLGLLLAASLISQAAGPASRRAVEDAMKQGHWDEALQLAKLRLEAGEASGDDLRAAALCLQRLNRIDETDRLIQRSVERYADDPALLLAAMESYVRAPHYGHEIAGEFHRGPQRGGGAMVSVEEADRVRVLLLGLTALDRGADDELATRILDQLGEQLIASRQGRYAWRLQKLTDLEGELPEPATHVNRGWGRGFGGGGSGVAQSDPPVAADGEGPLLYEVPEGWSAAKNDGERWRWTLAEAARRTPSRAKQSDLAYADFLRGQFGVQTLVHQGWFRPADDDGPAAETSALAVETLDDAETIARLATGVRRFTLPAGHRYLELYREHHQWQHLAEIFLNRNQRPKAVEATRHALEAADNEHLREGFQKSLDQLIDPWVRFENSVTQPAGEGAGLRVTHRNAGKVRFVAQRVNLDRLLADVRALLKNPPEDGIRQSLDVERLGWRLVNENRDQYLDEEAANWSTEIETPPDHRDGQTLITTPLQDPGAYLVSATPLASDGAEGAESMVVVWVADTALVRKPTRDGVLYQVLDARHGRPVAGAAVELFGYRSTRQSPQGERFEKPRLETSLVAEASDKDGLAAFDVAPAGDEEGYQWLATARTKSGRLAHLGFSGVWRSYVPGDPPRTARTFVVTDRPVYRPGDRVEFKAWIGKPDYLAAAANGEEPVPSEYAHKEFQVDLYDARGEKTETLRLTADAFGGVVGSHPLGEGAALGAYRIDVVGFGGGGFRVEEYRKPEFEVVVDAPEEPTRLGKPFEAVVRANYYAGTPVRGGSVKYKVIRTKKTDRWLPPMPWDWLYGRGYGWLGQDATWRSDWRQWGCMAPMPPWWNQPSGPPEVVAEGEAELDDEGVLRLPIETATAAERYPKSDHEYQITAEVTDSGRRTIVGEGSVLAARRPVEVTVWLGGGFYDVGDTVEARVSVRRPDGEPVAGEGELRLLKIAPPSEEQPAGDEGDPVALVDPEETLVQAWRLPTNSSGTAEMRLKASEPGRYRLVYRSESAKRPIDGGVVFTINGPGFDGAAFRFGELEVVPDKSEYAPGETARLLINTDRIGSAVTLFVRPVGGVYQTPRVLLLEGKSTVVELAVARDDMPNFFVEAHTVSDGKLHTVVRQIVVPPESRVLNVDAEPSAPTYLPGEVGTLRVRLTDADGEPIVGSATIAVYDRSVEAIAGGPSGGDIRERFWDWTRSHHPNTTHSLNRNEGPVTAPNVPAMQSLGVFGNIVPHRGGGAGAFGLVPTMSAPAPMAMAAEMADGAAEPRMALGRSAKTDGGGDEASPEVSVRENFADTAVWIGSVETDAEGFANVPMPLPESLTAWKVRVWAVSSGLRVGQGESEVVTRKDLMVRLRAPRFLVEGDEVTLSALVQNESPRDLSVRVRLEAEGGSIATPAKPSKVVGVPAGGEALVDWRVTASAEGEAALRAIAAAEGEAAADFSDAMQIKLPVLVHGAERVESFSSVIQPDERIATFELVVPAKRRPEATRLEARYAPTLVGAMLDSLPYLIEFPHGCTEQTLNRFLPAVIVRQTAKDLGVALEDLKPTDPVEGPPGRLAPVFDSEQLDALVKAGVERLTQMQLSDGGWGWFSGLGEHSSAHTTAVVVRGLVVANQSGVAVPEGVVAQGLEWLDRYRTEQLARLANVDDEGAPIDDDKPWKTRADDLDALVELALAESGRAEDTMLGRLFEDRLQLAPYSLATLGLALHERATGDAGQAAKRQATEWRDGVLRNLRQFVETDDENQTAYLNLPGGYWWRWYGSEFEAHAYFLKLLAATEPKGDLAPKLVKYLLANRRHASRWNSTRDTALVVEAMADYVAASGEALFEGPEQCVVEVWLDGKLRDKQEITSENALRFDGRFTLEGDSLGAGRHTLELRKRGGGRLYAGVSLTNFSLEDDLRAGGLEVRVKRRVQKLVPIEATGDDVGARGGLLAPKVERYRRIDVPNLGVVQSGDLIEVELTIASKNDYEYLVIEDPKAAGFEPVEVRSGYNGNAMGAYVEFRDQQVRFYARTLARGERTVRYRLRAETPGKYAALPTQIRAMYAPELRGNSDEVRVVVEDAP